jgi:class 3 adenylate cyclase
MAEPAQPIERKLAAIFAADVARYSRLMRADEAGTMRALRRIVRSWIGSSLGIVVA